MVKRNLSLSVVQLSHTKLKAEHSDTIIIPKDPSNGYVKSSQNSFLTYFDLI